MHLLKKSILALLASLALAFALTNCSGPTQAGPSGPGYSSGGYSGGGTMTSELLGRHRAMSR